MSRPVAGVRNKSVVITLPGSPKGARENLQAVLKTLPHACLQAAGLDSRTLHAGGIKKLEAEAGIASGGSVSGSSSGGHSHSHHSHGHSHGHDHSHKYGHSHGHGHGHGNLVRHTAPSSSGSNPLSNDPKLGPSRRNRESPYPMLSVEEALEKIRQHTPAPQVVVSKVDSSSLPGAVLAEDVVARENVPAFRASIVDGYAVVVPKKTKDNNDEDGSSSNSSMRGVYPVVSVSHAAPGEAMEPLREGQVARITTGAPLPPGATSVVMVEDTVLRTLADDGKEEKEIEILADEGAPPVREGENIREVGSDIRAGETVLRRGERVSAVGGEIGLLAAVGAAEVRTYRRPVVGVLSTGDEIVDLHAPATDDEGDSTGEKGQGRKQRTLRPGEVRDSNRPALLAAAAERGFPTVDLGIAADKPGALEAALRDALRRVDVLITTGGVSMGELDLLKPTVERALGGTVHFGRVAMKPGKPTTFATVPVKDVVPVTSTTEAEAEAGPGTRRSDRLVFGLPGNPASALVTFHLFALPALHRLAGYPEPRVGLPRVPGVALAHDFALDRARPELHRAVVSVSVSVSGGLEASSTGGQRSSRVGSLRGANALLCLPRGEGPLRKGERVDALLMGEIGVGGAHS
ncbi:hypothetical protein SLS62_003982 [Diatrype stigma]|uniref:MoaB/Mog domain-containing protein n=1 Tax=Diatrype stigma TaxID=117547 RepID=A0AAN9UUC5_9PEZI